MKLNLDSCQGGCRPCKGQRGPAKPRGTCAWSPPPGRCERRCWPRCRCGGCHTPAPSLRPAGTTRPPVARTSRSCAWCRCLWQWSRDRTGILECAESFARPPCQSVGLKGANCCYQRNWNILLKDLFIFYCTIGLRGSVQTWRLSVGAILMVPLVKRLHNNQVRSGFFAIVFKNSCYDFLLLPAERNQGRQLPVIIIVILFEL